jgi:hypothetical protein
MSRGKRAGSRPKRRFRPVLLVLALAITVAVVAWGFLVYAAIEFGGEARDGDSQAWWWLAVAATGAAACLFVALMLIARLSRALGLTEPPAPKVIAEVKVDPHADFRPPSGSAPGGRRRAG